ncbi:MAG: hypothetical protein ACK5TQ_00635 [Acetobacteraceae bacterium]
MTRAIFEGPPDNTAARAGAFLVNWHGSTGNVAPEVSGAITQSSHLTTCWLALNPETFPA